MHTYEHSVLLSADKCIGCTTCVRHCPTEAIRIRDGRAVINESRCIDCGECIRTCPQKAKKAVCNKLEAMDGFKWKIALPAPALYGQFENLEDVDYVLSGLLTVGGATLVLSLQSGFSAAAAKSPEMGVAAMAVSLVVVPVVSALTKNKHEDHGAAGGRRPAEFGL